MGRRAHRCSHRWPGDGLEMDNPAVGQIFRHADLTGSLNDLGYIFMGTISAVVIYQAYGERLITPIESL